MDTDGTIEAIVEKFKAFDLNGDGVIELDELTAVLTQLDDSFWSTGNLVRLLNSMDSDKDGRIDYEDFVCYIFRKPKASRKSCKVRREFGNEFAREGSKRLSHGSLNFGKAEAALCALSGESDAFVDRAVWATPDPPVGALGVLEAVIELLMGVEPLIKEFKLDQQPRSWKDVTVLIHDPHIFVMMLQSFASKMAEDRGKVPQANVESAKEVLVQLGKRDLSRAKKSDSRSLSLLSVWIESIVNYGMLVEAECSSDDEEEMESVNSNPFYQTTESKWTFQSA